MKTGLTKREGKLMSNLRQKKHKTLTAAAKDAGYAANTPHSAIQRSVRSVLGKYLRALEAAGATDKKSARVISEAMNADKDVFNDEGECVATKPDHPTRLKANEQFLKVKKLLEPEEQGGSSANVSVTVVIANENTSPQEPGNRISEFIQV